MKIFLLKIKNFFLHLNWIKLATMTPVFIASLVLSVYMTSFSAHLQSQNEENALANAPYLTAADETSAFTETTLPETTAEETTTETEITTTQKYKANKKVETVLASGNKKKDEDIGNDKVKDESLEKEEVSPEETVPEHNIEEIPIPIPTPKPSEEKPKEYVYVDAENLSGWNEFNEDLFYFEPETHQLLHGLHGFDNNKEDKFPGFYYFFNDYGAKASKLGIDVSYHNGYIDWQQVKESGIDFVIVRVGFRGYGTSDPVKPVMMDKKCEENIKGAKAAGLDIGLYFYSQAITVEEALDEAGACIQIAKKYAIEYPIYFDTEYATPKHTGRADNLSKKERTDFAVAFCEAIKNEGYTPGVYASKNFFDNNLEFNRIQNYEIWVAHYTNKKSGTDFKHPYEMWQYASDGRVNGIDKYTDVNICYYDYTTHSKMKNNGKYVVFTDAAGKQQYDAAEEAVRVYSDSKTLEDLNHANALILDLPREDIKTYLLVKLQKINLETNTETQSEQTTTEPISKQDITTTTKIESQSENITDT